jgi:glycosyltransferase involved in cell wall biosynthesis
LDQLLIYLFYIFLGVTTINVCYHLLFFTFAFAPACPAGRKGLSKENTPKNASSQDKLPSVSVIVCAKNEAENLRQYLPTLIAQKYPDFEIILINDASHDETEAVMEEFALGAPNIKQVNVENIEAFWGNKKYALTLGIKAASHNHLLFIDADCYPNSDTWIQEMAGKFTDTKTLILGYGGYKKIKKSWLNLLIRYETVLTAMQYMSYAMAGKPYMGVGRNLAYTRELFFEQRGFINHMKIQSGDDDLFVNEAGNKENTAVNYHPDSFTISEPKRTFKSWYTQKRRHVNVSKYYNPSDKFLLGLYYSSQLLFCILGILLLCYQYQWEVMLIVIGIRYLFAWLAIAASANKLQEKDVAYLFPIHELFLILFQLGIFSANLISKPNRWK